MDTCTIVVIDDDELLRDLLAEWLVSAGYDVCTAADGRAGLAAVQAHAPALVVTDMQMPDVDGREVISRLKQSHPALPVIAISGHFPGPQRAAADEALALGAARALAKPFKRREFLSAVADLLAGSSGAA